ncbi:lipoprotein [Sphingobacterium bovistauri]|uniref:Late embryogenesis abundant protein n=1 Tax=Sphingobacterium bovistauri TaxID=2781959 RepID=A0ABS7Z4V8_9SPHI|nr:lipoprotein [Sphingobacterium bovistauri]MCA5004592.1 hypothetical protein [Sphingobacterium bovistauri]
MKRIGLLFVATTVFILSGCALNQRAQIEALGKFNYDVTSVQNMRVAGRDINSFETDGGGVSLNSLPGIAMALLTKDLPLEATVNLQLSNPTSTLTKINEFKYLIEMGGKPLFEGSVNENINLAQGQSMVVPLSFRANLFGVAKERGIENVLSDILTRKSDAFLALKIKPSIKIGGKNYFYPGYITVDKDFGKSISRSVTKGIDRIK